MATQREIKNRIQSVVSTKKITKTMEMISTSKMKKMQNRLVLSKPFEIKLEMIIHYLKATGINIKDLDIAKEMPEPSKILIIMVTGNRGLCGGYNTNVIENTIEFKERLEEEGKNVQVHVIGKKGSNYFKFIDLEAYRSEINPDDKVAFYDINSFGNDISTLFETGEFDEIHISYTSVVTTTSFKPAIYRILPLSIKDIEEKEIQSSFRPDWKDFPVEYKIEPDPMRALSLLFPLYLKAKLYTSILESNFAEQFARRVAMKNATDAATDMVQDLTIKYNRARQSKITNEIAEIVGGASALE